MAAGGGHVVSIISREIVVPAKPTERENYFLSCFDVSWKGSHYNPRVIFYESTKGVSSGQDDDDDGRTVMEKLKSSLALCLVHYYPCCGRFSPGDRLFIDCNDAGVEFVEASLDLPLSHRAFQFKPFFQHLCPQLDHSGVRLYSTPLLSIQATLFSDGGLALGITQNHVVADGQALWNFMVSWGECARGLPLSLPPFLDRKMLAVLNPSLDKPTWELNPKTKGVKVQEEEDKQNEDAKMGESMGTHSSSEGPQIDPSTTASAGTGPSAEGDTKRIPCVFNFPYSAVKKLKIEDGGVHTSYEVTCAHLWKRVTAARRRPSHEPTHFFVIANCRSRMNPPLPPTFYGNAIVFGISECTSGKIFSESLHATASRIHETIVEITQDSYIKNFIHWMESHDNDFLRAILPKFPKEGKGIYTASSPRFPVYEVDFGWGKPMAIRTPSVPEDGELVFFGGHPKSALGDTEICMEICMGFPSSVLRNLLEDPSFLGKPPCSPYEDE